MNAVGSLTPTSRPGDSESTRTGSSLTAAIERASDCLLSLQQPDGHWVAELEGDTILESEYILLMAFLGREREERCRKAAVYIARKQMDSGGWSNYPGGPADLSVSVKAYFALKLTGADPESRPMVRARQVIRDLGGAAGCNSFTRFYLAMLGQIPYENCPAVPPEIVLLPSWAYINIYAMSSWTRSIVVPLSIFYAHRPVRTLPTERGISELYLRPPHTRFPPHPPTRRWLTWTNFFLGIDRVIKCFDALGTGPLRRLAIRRATRWMLDRFEDSDGLGAIFPPMIYTVISLKCLGYPEDSPEMRWALRQLDDLIIEEKDSLRLQPCLSPVWDTALALNALAEGGAVRGHPAIDWGVRWLLEREVRRRGDWSVRTPDLEPGGWFFEYRNAFYPDTDDTAMVLLALARNHQAGTPAKWIDPVRRAVAWLIGMQNRDGGWAAFDRDIDREVLTHVPFADHNAMLDPSCPDITARVLEALSYFGFRVGHPVVDRAVRFICKTQERDGSWYGRWGVNYLYGTWQVLAGLAHVGFDMRDPAIRKATDWLCSVQQPSGGWGETCGSYDDPTLAGQGDPTASQTAWALLGLMAAGDHDTPAVRNGIAYLLATQGPDGNWEEEPFTGTGFPRVFYLKYHLYRLYFPLMALGRHAAAIAPGEAQQPAASPRHVGYHAPTS